MTWVKPLSDPDCTSAAEAGTKAANLAELLQAGFNVPAAFVIGISSFRAHFPEASPSQTPSLPVLNDELNSAVADACGSVFDHEGPLVVRSSALGEDAAEQSFAGQHSTYYYVQPEMLPDTICRCWLSLWSDHALAYRRLAGANGDDFGMAVIVQRMVQADRAGVCFTTDPTGQLPDHQLIEATWGLGAALVDGRVSADRYWLNGDHRVKHRQIARKRHKVAEKLLDPALARLEPIPLKQQSKATLTDSEAETIAGLCKRAASHFGSPQDIEWAMEDERVFLLQSRPITQTMRIGTDTTVTDGQWVLFKPIAENLTEPLTPMTVDLYACVLPSIGRFIRGRLYLNLNAMRRLLPVSLSDSELAELLLFRRSHTEIQLNWRALPATIALAIGSYLIAGVAWHRTARISLPGLDGFRALCQRVRQDDSLNARDAILRLFLGKHPFEPISHFTFQANYSSGRYFLLLVLLRRLLTRWAPNLEANVLIQACAGYDEMRSRDMIESLIAMTELARNDPQLLATLTGDEPVETIALLTKHGNRHPFSMAMSRFQAEYGHRCIKEVELSSPRWREDPTSVLNMVRTHLKGERHRAEPHGLRLAALDQVHQALPGRWQRALVDKLIERVRYYVTLREDTRHFHTMALDTVRQKLKLMEQDLMQEDKLRCADDIFFLKWPEAVALSNDALTWTDVESRIRHRRQAYQRESRQTPFEVYNVEQAPVLTRTAAIGVLNGECACPGTVEGTARVVFDPSIDTPLEPGEVLIAPYTDPAWTPLFPAASAIVVEVGSFLSHAATVAREYQIPCVVDVANCTKLIQTGQRVRIFADEGQVEVLP